MLTDHDVVIRGLDIKKPSIDHIYSLMRVLHERAVNCIDMGTAAPLMEFFYSNLSQTLAKIDNSRFACGKGCYFCCTSWVAASPPELFYLLHSLPEDRSQEIRTNIASAFAATKDIAEDDRQKMLTPCPMLHDGQCSVYDVRPLVCRTLVSHSLPTCERIYTEFTGEQVPHSHGYNVLRNVYALALAGALRQAGLSAYFYEFNAALDRLIEFEEAEKKWLSGEDILAGIPVDRGGDMFSDPWNRQVYEEAFKTGAVGYRAATDAASSR